MSIKNILKRSSAYKFRSGAYWESRYASDGNSGDGSYGRLATFKATVINNLVKEKAILSVIEFGCGDGNNLTHYDFQCYTGVDVSKTAIGMCRRRFAHMPYSFKTLADYITEPSAIQDMAISIDVIFHLVEDEVYQDYMERLFSCSSKCVLIYSSCVNYQQAEHVRHRNFLHWVASKMPKWSLTKVIPNEFPAPDLMADLPGTSFADFYLYERTE